MKRIKQFLKDVVSFAIYLVLCLFPSRGKSAVLAYHSVDYIDPEKDPWRMNKTPERFDEHLKFISKYKGAVEITFDDGFKNNFTYAYPLLLKYGLTATIFLPVDFIDGKIDSAKIWDIGRKIEPLGWQDIKVMHASGIKFGSHAKSHRNLAALPQEEMEEEISGSKKRLEEMLGKVIDSFCYPIGARGTFDSGTKDAVRRSGYIRAYTNVMGLNAAPFADNYALKRIRINTEDGVFRLRMKLKGAYSWVDWFNRLS